MMKTFLRELKWTSNHLMDDLIAFVANPNNNYDLDYTWYKFMNCILYHPWYTLVRGMRNIRYFFTTIWCVDVWDSHYLHDLMDKQIATMEKFWYSDNTNIMRANQIAKRITWTRKLYSLYKDEYYTMKCFHEFHGDDFWDKELSKEERESYFIASQEAHDKDMKVWKLYIKNLERSREWSD